VPALTAAGVTVVGLAVLVGAAVPGLRQVPTLVMLGAATFRLQLL